MAKTQAADAKGASAFLFQRDGMPPVAEMLPCALQHVLASFAGIITPAILIAATFNFTTEQRTDIIQVALILSALDTGLQAFAPFRRIGGNLPIVMGVSFAFLPALQAMGATFSFGSLLGGEIVGGVAAILFGLFRALGNVHAGIPFLASMEIPPAVYNMLPYIVSLIVLAFTSKKSRAPKAEGIPYDKGQR